MCFILTVTGKVLKPLDFAYDDTLRVDFEKTSKSVFGNSEQAANVTGHISETDDFAGGLLSDSADWDAAVWDIRPEVLPFLRRTVERLSSLFGADFTFQAHWIGEKAKGELLVTVDEFINIVNENRIANFTLYRIQSGPN